MQGAQNKHLAYNLLKIVNFFALFVLKFVHLRRNLRINNKIIRLLFT